MPVQRSRVEKPQMVPCPQCDGTGAKRDCYAAQKAAAEKRGVPVRVECACCPNCEGTGWRLATAMPECPKCGRRKLPMGEAITDNLREKLCCPVVNVEDYHPDRDPECGYYYSDPLPTDEWRGPIDC